MYHIQIQFVLTSIAPRDLFFARLLLSETLIKYLTIILSVTAHITFGMGIEAVDNNYLHLDIAGWMFNLLGQYYISDNL